MNARDRIHLVIRLRAMGRDIENLIDWVTGEIDGPQEFKPFKRAPSAKDEYVPGEEIR